MIFDVTRGQQDAGIGRQYLGRQVPRRGSLPRPARSGPASNERGRFPPGPLIPGGVPAGRSGSWPPDRPPGAGPPGGAAPHASRSCSRCRPGSPAGGHAQRHGPAAPSISCLPGQGQQQPACRLPTARFAGFPWSEQTGQDPQRRGQARYLIVTFIAVGARRLGRQAVPAWTGSPRANPRSEFLEGSVLQNSRITRTPSSNLILRHLLILW